MDSTTLARAGIDVGKRNLCYCVHGQKPKNTSNSASGIDHMTKELAKFIPFGAPVYLESTGGYERQASVKLAEAGFEPRLVSPYHAHHRAKSEAVGGKTDSVDARFLAKMGPSLRTREPAAQREHDARAFTRGITALTMLSASLKLLRDSGAQVDAVSEACASVSRFINERIVELRREFVKEAKGTSLGRDVELLQTIPGIGPVSAMVLASELAGKIEGFSNEQVCSFAGLAPMDNSSGGRVSPKKVRRGNGAIKRVLFMCAHSFRRTEWGCKLAKRLASEGRHFLQVQTALMRKGLMRVLAVLRRQTPWTETPP